MMQVTTADVCEDGERCACYDYWVRATGTWSVLLLLLLAVTALHVSHPTRPCALSRLPLVPRITHHLQFTNSANNTTRGWCQP
jgi:hypothetical protein